MPRKDRQTNRMTPGFTGPFKGKPQQGTLFDKRAVDELPGNTGQRMNRIGPRGYSLARSQQFQGIVQGMSGGSGRDKTVLRHPYKSAEGVENYETVQGYSDRSHTIPAVEPDKHMYGPANLGPKHNGPMEQADYDAHLAKDPHAFDTQTQMRRAMGRPTSKLIDTLARSGADPEHMKGLSEINVVPGRENLAGTYHHSQGAGHPARITLDTTDDSEAEEYAPDRVKNPQQRGSVHPDQEITLLHELGHHVSHVAGTWHSSYHDQTSRAGEEGFADRYAMETWRRDPRGQSWHGRFDPREHTYGARGHAYGSYPEYRRNLGAENAAPAKRAYTTPKQEALERPMLGQGEHMGVFDTALPDVIKQGFNRRYDTSPDADSNKVSLTDAEYAWHAKKRQSTNAAVSRVSQEPLTGERWQPGNRNLGRQF